MVWNLNGWTKIKTWLIWVHWWSIPMECLVLCEVINNKNANCMWKSSKIWSDGDYGCWYCCCFTHRIDHIICNIIHSWTPRSQNNRFEIISFHFDFFRIWLLLIIRWKMTSTSLNRWYRQTNQHSNVTVQITMVWRQRNKRVKRRGNVERWKHLISYFIFPVK